MWVFTVADSLNKAYVYSVFEKYPGTYLGPADMVVQFSGVQNSVSVP